MEQCIKLSTERAETVKKLLIDFGADSSRIKTKGLGYTKNPLRVNDLNENGYLLESEAKKNRAVYILTDNNTELLEELGL